MNSFDMDPSIIFISVGYVTKKQNTRKKIKKGGMVYADTGRKEETEKWYRKQIRTG